MLSPVRLGYWTTRGYANWRTANWLTGFSYSLDCKAVATCRIPDTYKPKPNPYLNTNPNPNPNPTNPTSILSKFSRNNYLAYSLKSTKIIYGTSHRLVNLQTSQLVDWTSRGLNNWRMPTMWTSNNVPNH